MGDYPNTTQLPLTIWTFSRYSLLIGNRGIQGASGALASLAWGTANLGIFVPFELPMAYPVKNLFWQNGGVQSGNIDVGVYSDDLTRICSTGSVACGAITTVQFAPPTADVILTPGNYYWGVSMSSTTGTIYCQTTGNVAHCREMGLFQMAAAGPPLPAAATIAAIGSARVPALGMTYKTGTPTF
jgi:hypothetical protein